MNARLEQWEIGGSYLQLAGHRHFVRTTQHGPTVLLLHGYPVGSYDWHAIWPYLASHFRLVAPDMLGHGFSAKPLQADYAVEAHADRCAELLARMGIEACHVVACDLGVSVAQELLARQSDPGHQNVPQIQSITLLNGGMCPHAYRPRLLQRLLLSPLGPWIARRITKKQFAQPVQRMYGHNPPIDDAVLDDFWELVTHHDGLAVAHKVGAFWSTRLHIAKRLVTALQETENPLLIINGGGDPNSGAHMLEAFLQLRPHARVIRHPELGHWPHIQAPEAVVSSIRTFITTVEMQQRKPTQGKS